MSNNLVTIMVGTSGAGKDHFIKEEILNNVAVYSNPVEIISTDDYMQVCLDCNDRKANLADGHPLRSPLLTPRCITHRFEYQFSFTNLELGHGLCYGTFSKMLELNYQHVVVNNTNTTVAEIGPYITCAQARKAMGDEYEVEIVVVRCDPEVAAARNVHGVSLKAVRDMNDRISHLLEKDWARWYPNPRIIDNG
ncbi:hypothetical protein LCGC14_3022280 [marine sediment metagenome]|uniref:Uncharacterized protein n=1 Tax=marine sediment metagenome TaxID=412755 RepID=A0A0F8ZL27_9ZZZZ